MVFLETQHIHHRPPACERSARRTSYLEGERERESPLNAPSCTRNTYKYETNDTTTLINSYECVYNTGFVISRIRSHSFPRAHKYTPGPTDRTGRRAITRI